MTLHFIQAQTPADYAAAKTLFQEYAAALPIDLCFQGFEAELAAIVTQYGPPEGGLLLVVSEVGEALGCVGIRKHKPQIAELKRMYLRPEYQGRGIGKALLQQAIQLARNLKYREIWLDTLASMQPAIHTYEAAGFREIPAYYPNPHAGVRYMGMVL